MAIDFILIREKKSGEIIHKEILDNKDYSTDRQLAEAVADKVMDYEKKYPFSGYEVISGSGNSIEEYLEGFPEYKPYR